MTEADSTMFPFKGAKRLEAADLEYGTCKAVIMLLPAKYLNTVEMKTSSRYQKDTIPRLEMVQLELTSYSFC